MSWLEWTEWALLLAGLAAVHLTWQTCVAGLAVSGLLRSRHAGPRLRYSVALALFLALPPLAALTAVWVAGAGAPPEAVGYEIGDAAAPVSLLALLGPWAGGLWLVGAVFEASRLIRAAGRARTLARSGESAGAHLEDRVREHGRRLGVARRPDVRVSRDLRVPSVVGVRRPTLLVPADLRATLRGDEVDAILAHELSHVRRRDLLAHAAQRGVRALLFYHPVARWLSGVIDRERELCCDDLVTAAGVSARTYARALARVAVSSAAPGPGLAAAHGDVASRVRRLMRPGLPGRAERILAPAVLFVLLTLGGSATVARTLAPITERAARTAPAWEARVLADTRQTYTVNATDPAGAFTVSVRNGRAVGATIDGRALPADRIRQRGARVTLDPGTDGRRFSVRLRPSGGIQWPARPADSR